jgi:hypothetical protein
MTSSGNTTQENLFEAIKRKVGEDVNLAQEMMSLLKISKDGAYRRLNGKIQLSLEEATQIAGYFGIVLADLIATNREQVLFDFSYLSRPVNNLVEYLLPLDQDLSLLQRLNNPYVYFATNDIPMFHNFQFPRLALFKLFFWGYTVWKIPNMQKQKFSLKLVEGQSLRLCQSIAKKYASIPSEEYWTPEMIDNTMNRIKFGLGSGFFENPQDALVLIEDLKNLIDHNEHMAEIGKKFVYGTNPDDSKVAFKFHRNDLFITSVTVLVKTDTQRIVYHVFDNPNYMRSTADSVCNHADAWFDKLRRYSVNMTVANEQERKAYFNYLRERIEAGLQSIKKTHLS